MPIPIDADWRLGSVYLRADESQIEFGRPPCRHWTRSLFSETVQIPGQEGGRNIRPEQLRHDMTKFVGEGQRAIEADDPILAHRFYTSEGLDFRTFGEFKLNRSFLVTSPLDSTGGSTATVQGNDFTDVTGTSTTVNTTDKRLNAVADEIQSTAHTPGAGKVEVQFFVYNEGIQLTTIEGSSFVEMAGPTVVTGDDIRLQASGAKVRSTNLSVTAGVATQVNLIARKSVSSNRNPTISVRVVNVTNDNVVIGNGTVKVTDTSNATVYTGVFTPVSGKTYRVVVGYEWTPGDENVDPIIEETTYGAVLDPDNQVRVVVYNDTGAAEVSGTAKTVPVPNTSTLNIVNVTFTAAAATNYKYRVRYTAGAQRPIVDKVTATVQTTAAAGWTINDIELGLGGNVWLVGSRSGVDSNTWIYDFTNEVWDEVQAITGATAAVCRGLAHTDKYQYGVFSDGKVYQWDAATTDNDYTAAITGAVGIAICQNRLFVLSEDATNGVDITTFAVDADVSSAATASLATAEVTAALNTADTNLRQRMVGTTTGARFFVNYSDVTCVIYEADTSSGSLVISEIGRLEQGAKGTCITYAGGITFIGGQFFAETNETPISALWAIDQQDQIVRVGYFRRDDPIASAPQKMQAYENDLWIQQGERIWRYSLVTGGLFLEYELNPSDATTQVGCAVVKAHQFFGYSSEGVFVTGSIGTYRPSGAMVSSVFYNGLPGVTKQLDFLEVTTDELPSNTAVAIAYDADQTGTFTDVGTLTSGSKHRIIVSGPEEGTVFYETLQIQATLQSLTGVNTPTVRAISTRGFPAEFEHMVDLLVRCNDEDSYDHVSGRQVPGHQIARAIRDMHERQDLVVFEDNYDALPENISAGTQQYRCRIEEYDQVYTKRGESSMRLRLRVLEDA